VLEKETNYENETHRHFPVPDPCLPESVRLRTEGRDNANNHGAPDPRQPVIRCSTTTSVNDSGLMAYLEPLFEAETGYDVQITSNGTARP
jgi:hypothetical protein